MANLRAGAISVTSTGHHFISTGADEPVLVKNVGPETVYVGRAYRNVSSPIVIESSYPLVAGEAREFPAIADNSNQDNYILGINTGAGTSEVRYIGRGV